MLGALETLIAKKQAIKQAAMQQLLTGNTRLPGFSGVLGRRGESVRYYSPMNDQITTSCDNQDKYLERGDVPVLRSAPQMFVLG